MNKKNNKKNKELTKSKKILIITGIISLILFLIGILSGDVGILGNIIIISLLLITLPQLIITYIEYKEFREMEQKFSIFLRDLTESTRSGIPLHKAIINASKIDYGALNKEIKKMAYQLSWGVNIIKVLEQSKERLKESDILSKNIRILIETYKSGGSIDTTLDSLANTLMTIQDTQEERKSILSQYVVVMYAITLIFISIIVGIERLMVPIFTSSIGGGGPIGTIVVNPCEQCLYIDGFSCSPCYLYFSICSIFNSEKSSISCYYLALFFSIVIVQAISGGLVAGQISEGSIKAGIKHSLILSTSSFAIFFILVRIGLLGG